MRQQARVILCMESKESDRRGIKKNVQGQDVGSNETPSACRFVQEDLKVNLRTIRRMGKGGMKARMEFTTVPMVSWIS